MNATNLRKDIYRILDRVLASGVPVEIERRGRLLRIEAVEPAGRLANLSRREEYLAVDAEELVHLDWSSEWRPDGD